MSGATHALGCKLYGTPAVALADTYRVVGGTMPDRRGLGERAQDTSAAACRHAVETAVANRPRIFILSGVRLYREGVVLTLGRTGAVDILGAAAPPERE